MHCFAVIIVKKKQKKDKKATLAKMHNAKVTDVGGDAEWGEAERSLVAWRNKYINDLVVEL